MLRWTKGVWVRERCDERIWARVRWETGGHEEGRRSQWQAWGCRSTVRSAQGASRRSFGALGRSRRVWHWTTSRFKYGGWECSGGLWRRGRGEGRERKTCGYLVKLCQSPLKPERGENNKVCVWIGRLPSYLLASSPTGRVELSLKVLEQDRKQKHAAIALPRNK